MRPLGWTPMTQEEELPNPDGEEGESFTMWWSLNIIREFRTRGLVVDAPRLGSVGSVNHHVRGSCDSPCLQIKTGRVV